MARPVGTATRGTTGAHRLARVDRWLVATQGPLLRSAPDPFVVDLGFGASPVTTVEMFRRLRTRIRPDVEVLGLEIDPARVAAATASAEPGLAFAVGGFEVPTGARLPVLIRAFNVLRQYDEARVAPVWDLLGDRLAPDGVLIEGTCDEPGRLAAWVTLRRRGAFTVPHSLTLAAQVTTLERPSDLAARLPKALIHRNVPGERIFEVLASLDRAWAAAAPIGVFGARQRWVTAVTASELPVLSGGSAHRRGEVTFAWDVVRPLNDPGC